MSGGDAMTWRGAAKSRVLEGAGAAFAVSECARLWAGPSVLISPLAAVSFSPLLRSTIVTLLFACVESLARVAIVSTLTSDAAAES